MSNSNHLKQTFSNFTFIVSLKLFYKLLKDKINMYLHLSETKLETILGTILKNSIKNFSIYIQYLAYLQLMCTSVINLFKNIPIPDFSILAMFLCFRVIPSLP